MKEGFGEGPTPSFPRENSIEQTAEQSAGSAFSVMRDDNRKAVSIGSDKIAWRFNNIDLDAKYHMLGSREYPSYFYLRTRSGNIYKIMKVGSTQLDEIIINSKLAAGQREQIYNQISTDWVICNPKTRKIVEVKNNLIGAGEPFEYVKGWTTSQVVEIVGVSSSFSPGIDQNIQSKSSIEEDFNNLNKKSI